MASWTALNIEPDDHSDDEVDNTKELHIEEALKLYQAALKLHSQGPTKYAAAADAYIQLFQSEIFRYPESETEFNRLDRHPELEFADPYGLDLAAAGVDGLPSTLPQILYLSHKNHGQFILDCVKSRLRSEPLAKPYLEYQGRAAIDNFAKALASDESDAELWRRTARIGAMLGSKRIARYCLEAAVEVDDDPTIAEVEPASLEEGYAGEQLKEQLNVLSDETALSHPIMAPFVEKEMPKFLAKHMDPYPYLQDGTKSIEPGLESITPDTIDQRIIIHVEHRTWADLGDKLCEAFIASFALARTGIVIRLPAETLPNVDMAETVTPADQIMQDVDVTESPVPETTEAAPAPPVAAQSEEGHVEIITTTTTVPLSDEPPPSSVTLPTRKRSQSAAGIRETPEDDSSTQKRSKRIRNRETTMEEAVDLATQYAEVLKEYVEADGHVFDFANGILSKLGVNDLGSYSTLQTALAKEDSTDRVDILTNTALRDLRHILRNWNETFGKTFTSSNAADILGSTAGSANAGLAAFLEHSKSGPHKLSNIPLFADSDGLASFATNVENNWMPLQDVIYEWLCAVLVTYRKMLWSDALKITVVRILSYVDADIFSRFQLEVKNVRSEGGNLEKLEELVQTLFELHVDIYSRITNPSSAVPYGTRIQQKDQLDRWAMFATEVVNSSQAGPNDEISLRYLWSSAFYATMADDVSREHQVLCWSDLQSSLSNSGHGAIELQNNAVMPDISIGAADREVSRLTTMDFFFNLFQNDRSDPVAVIETLEPVLDPESACQEGAESLESAPAAVRDMWKFLDGGSMSLRLFLWQRLREAYFSIGYNTKVFSCHLKCIEIIVGDFRAVDFVDSADEPRKHQLLTWLKALDDLLVKSLTIALNDAATCFEIIDERHIKSTCAALAQLNRVLHAAAVFEDEVRIGMTAANPSTGSFNGFLGKLREMQVRTWALQYTMIKEAVSQNRELFPTAENDMADYLGLVHYTLGLRKCCKASNKIFLKMMKVELMKLKHLDKWETYIGQVLFDLYGIRLGVGAYELADHGCPSESLDKRTVLNIAEQVIMLADRMPMKDLLKHEMRSTIERMQQAVGQAKPTPQMLHNLRNYTEYLKTSIRPLDMMKAWRGQIQVDSLPVVTSESPLADKGWYFLLGMIALTKFRSAKRVGPGTQTDDLRIAATFMRLQLQFSADRWETWYRLAQCFDHELEEEVMWSADKVNNHRPDLIRLQRGAIHCYVMALSTAARCADDNTATAEKLSEMYNDFGMRLYASSREPFGMEPFWVDEFEKHMSGVAGMYKKTLHDEMSRYRVWKYAARLFRKSLERQPNNWMNHFMLGKCLWKMFCKVDEEWDPKLRESKPKKNMILDAFINAIKTVPKQKEPILEPHYKLVSIVHKMVMLGVMEPQAGHDLLQQQPLTEQKVPIVILNLPEWEAYVLATLRHLRSADKQHWQHRMVARTASILYDDEKPDYSNAAGAIEEFRESMFTKTMQINVWKPDHERAGRHCVYMERYVRLMVRLLALVNDKASMEALVKRVRKKANEFHRFQIVWTECCTTYLKMIRRECNIVPGVDDMFKGVHSEEYDVLSERLQVWIADPQTSHPAVDALRETVELKKLNGTAMKPAPIDDLIGDAWALLYTEVAKTLPGPAANSLQQAQIDGESSTTAAVRAMGPMSLNNLVMDMNGTQIPVPVTIAGSEPSRPRKMGISRREILRRAELAISRAPDPLRAFAPTAKPRLSEATPNLTLGSNAEPLQQAQSTGTSTPQNEPQHEEEEEEENGEQEKDGDEESERGSLHDSADDESDLSDPPEDDEIDIFPNLIRKEAPATIGGGANSGTPSKE